MSNSWQICCGVAILSYNNNIIISLPEFNLPLIGSFTWLTPPRPYRAKICRGRELNFGSHTLFWQHENMDGIPGWVISSMMGPLPGQHKHERRYTPGTHSFIPTKRIWNNDYGNQMIIGDLVGLKFSDICLTGEEKPHPGNLYQPGIEPGPTAWQVHMLLPVPQRWTNNNNNNNNKRKCNNVTDGHKTLRIILILLMLRQLTQSERIFFP